MTAPYRTTWLLLLLCLLLSTMETMSSTTGRESETGSKRSSTLTEGADDSDEEDIAVLKETIADGRGDRDDAGVRDQWSSSDHIRVQYDTRKQPTEKILKLLRTYRLECNGCDHDEAVQKINAFVLETKRAAAQQAQRQLWLERVAWWVTVIAIFGGIGFWHHSTTNNGFTTVSSNGGMGQARRVEIEEQRRRAAAKRKEEEKALLKEVPPSWIEQEQSEIWTNKQEKQFEKALKSFGGVPPKARYTLIAERVDGKSRQECLMHHKLLQLIAKEQ